jgi:hypothetical protein
MQQKRALYLSAKRYIVKRTSVKRISVKKLAQWLCPILLLV